MDVDVDGDGEARRPPGLRGLASGLPWAQRLHPFRSPAPDDTSDRHLMTLRTFYDTVQ